MKFKTFILTFLMMMSCSISFGQGSLTGSATTEAQLWMHLNDDEIGTISLANDIKITATCPIPNGKKVTIDLNGHKLFTEEEIYIINNEGKLTITDNSEGKTGTISSTLGIYNGVTPTRTSVTDVKYDRVLTINGGVFNSSSKNGNAATIYNYRGVIKINGGEFYGEHSAITNYGMATIANAYIECLNRDNGAAAIINDYEITYGENVNIVGIYTTVTGTAYTTGTKPTYLFAELKNGPKYPSLQAALDACTTGDNTINLLFHNSDNATVSQKEGVNITIVGNGYKNKQFEYTGTIYVNGNSRSTGAETLTIQDVDFCTEKDTHDFISCNDGGNSVIRYAHNVTVQDCNFTATEGSTAVVALRFRQSYNINVVNSEFTNLHSAMWATGTSGIAFDNIKATKCKEGGISAGTSTPVNVKNSIIEGAKYGVRADGSGDYRLTVESSELTAEVPVIVRNTTGEYNLTVKEDATLASTNNGPQVVVTAGKDNEAYVTPTSDVNVTLDNVTSTFGLTAKIGNAFYATLQDAVDNAKTSEIVTLIADNCKEDVTVNQAPNYAITIDGAEKTFKGTITVDGKSARYETTALTIKNVNFDATEGITYDACIRLGNGTDATRYTNKVTVESCTFTDNDYSSVAVKSYTGGDLNLVVRDCEANGMHSLAQLKNIEQGLVISGNIANTKNGINLNQTAVGTIAGNEINVKGYAVRIGESTGGNITLNENTLKTDNTEGDPVIELRGTVVALNMEKNVVSGNTHIKGTAGTISVDANYWDGKEAPVVAEGSAPIVVNSYYSDDALTNLVRIPMGNDFTAYTREDAIWGEVGGNAIESFVIKVLDADGNVMGTTTLNNVGGIIDGSVYVTWSLKLNAESNTDEYWTMQWTTAPSIDNMPAKVELYVDGTRVGGGDVVLNAPDNLSKINAANIDADGKILAYRTNLTEAVNNGDNVAILVAGTYAVPTGKNLTITGAVDGVVFDNNGAANMGGASVTFNKVTFDYYPNVNYTGLQHSGNLVYNNCIINGQVFLYGTSETFNNCTFNQNSSDAYNVWTYGAKEVAFNECTFNSAGKSVLVYNEGACATDLTVTDTKFIATATVDDKAAIEIDCSLMPKGTSIVIDGVEEGKTTATGFGANTKSGSSLWNDKKVVEGAPNGGTSSEVIIDDVVVKEPALMNLAGGGTEENPYLISTLEDLIWFRYQVNAGENNYDDKYVKLAANIDLNNENWTPIGDITYNSQYKPVDASKVFSGVFDGNNKVIYNLTINKTVGGADTQANVGFFGMTGEGAVIKNLTLTNVNINTDGRNVGALIGYTYMATIDNITVNGNIQINGGNNVSGVAGMTRYYAMYATNIKVVGNDGSAIVGNNIVGGIFAEIAPNGSEHKFENLSVENVAITGVGGVGGIVGLLTTGAVDNVTVKNVVLTGRTDYQGNAMGRIRLGSVSGLMGGEYATIANATTENVTAKNLVGDAVVLPIIGANYSGDIGNATEAKIGDTYYATLQIAIDAAKAGDNTNTIQLLADITDDVTILQQEGINIVIDGKKAENENYQFDGTIYIEGNSRNTGAETLTIQNVNFYTENPIHDFISANSTDSDKRYAHNVTVKDCNFDAKEGSSAVVGLRIRQGYDLAVIGGESNNMHSLMQFSGCHGTTVDGVTFNGLSGVNLNTAYDVTIMNSEFNVAEYAVRVGENSEAQPTDKNITITNNKLTSTGGTDAVIIVRQSNDNNNLNISENNIIGDTHIAVTTTFNGSIAADANYWGEGLTGPVVDGTNVDVNSYYADEAREQLIVTALTLQQFVEKVTEGNGTYNGTFTEGGEEKNITVKVVPVSGDARTTDDVRVPNRLQKYTNPEVYYAQYQRFSGLTDVNISNVNFVFYPAAVTVTDAWNTAGATTTADNINGELQLLNTGSVLFADCSFEKMSVSPINAATLSVTSSEFNGLDAYAIKDIKATTATITGTTFTDCNGGFWFNNAPTTLTVTDNTFTGTGRRGAIQFSANGDYANTEMTVTGNEVTDEAAFLWQLNNTISNAQLNAILDKNNNTYEIAFVEGSVELHLQGEGTADNPYLINDISDLEFFRDDVNAGNNYAGKYIKVTATEIDLNNEEWTPIAYMGKTFIGNFDGNNVTVKNLKITKALTNSAENNGIGFFGRTDSPATIENIIIENVDITGSLYVGAIVGLGYTGKHVKGCTVKGNIAIDAWWYAGVIGGNGYMNLVDDCHVIGNNGSYIKGNEGSYIGGIWGFRGEGNNKITNCTVTNLNIIGVDRVGGICGIGHYGNTISGCDAEDVTVTATDPDATTIGLLVGATQGNDISGQGPTIFEDNDASGITAQIDNGDGTYTEVTNLYGTNINGSTPVTNYVAQIVGGTQYPTLAEAVAAAVNNDVITLLPTNAPIAMNASLYGKAVTITGTATVDWSKGNLFVGRGGEGNATLTFDNANLTSASNQASTGIHVSGREKGTDNKYDGTLVINNSTIELDYLINKGTMTLDNSTLTVKNGFSVGGRPAGETESGEDATATITLNNNSKVVVNNHNGMGLGYEAIGVMNIDATSTFETTQAFLVTAKGTMNVNGGNVKTVGTLTNNGAVNVTGNASMNVNTLTGNAINFTNVTIANANIGGAVNAFGTNNFTGETNIEGILSVGYNGSPAEQVVVNITGNFNGGNVLIGSSNDNVLNVGNAEGTETTAHFAQLGAFGDVNIVNADVTYGYTFIRNDFNVTNSTMEIKGGVNTYFSGNAKVVLDNTTWNLPGYANIGSYGGDMYGNADVTLKNGSSMTAANLGVEQYDGKTVILTLEDNSTLTATNLSNTGSIVLAGEEAKITSNELTGTNNVPTTNIEDHKVVYENGAYVVTAKHYVAQVKGTDNNVRVKFETFAEALDAVENGETIELLGTEGSEISKEIDFTEDIEFTITGNAPNYGLPIVTFQNATVNIENATILIPELDARQDATINVINSTVYDAGGNSIAKSYYNGAINISGTSEVYMMQVTTMGYINISGTAKLHATWQTNVYGNGLITLNEGATFNTAALQLTAKDYSGRDNTDADRVGQPAEIVVNGAILNVGKVQSSNGADYSYHSSYGINVGTIEGKSAILNIINGGTVNYFMKDGETANIGAGGTVNVNASTFNVACRAENGTVTLANAGTINVENATVEIAKLDNDNLLFISGENTFKVEDATGSSYALRAKDGVVFNNSYVKGTANETIRLLGSATFNGGFECAYLQGQKVIEDNPLNGGIGGTIAIEEGTTVHATYGVEISNDYTLNGGNIELSGGNADGDLWGFVFQNSECTINSNIKVVGNTGTYAPIHFTNVTATVNGNISQSNSGGEVIYIKNSEVTFAENSNVTTTTGVHVNDGSTLTNRGEINGNVTVNSTLLSENNITGTIVKAATATIQLTGGIYTTEPQDGWCAENYGAFPYDENSWVVRQISGEQTFELTAGWNWVSSYITEFNGTYGLEMLQNGLGTKGIQIKNDNYTSNYRNDSWGGGLGSVSVEEMYKVNMNGDVNFKFEGSFVNYDECEIVLRPGWNYIGYPVNVETNLADALVILSAYREPIEDNTNDILKSQQGTAYNTGSGWFIDNPFNLVPGKGYMYKNTSDDVKILRYTTKKATTTIETNIRSSKHWTVDATQYPSNMTMIAMTDVEGGNYEVAAFVNGEVRGSSRPVYVESLDAYILILTISGDDVEEMTFKCYDLTTGEEVEFSNRINYSNDAVVGSANEPYMLTRGTTGIGEAAISNVNIYPNPTTTGTEINLEATCDKVEVFNALGVKVVEYQNVDSIDALETAGIYVIRITNNGNVQNCRLVVK